MHDWSCSSVSTEKNWLHNAYPLQDQVFFSNLSEGLVCWVGKRQSLKIVHSDRSISANTTLKAKRAQELCESVAARISSIRSP